jgi:hypothetical protein
MARAAPKARSTDEGPLNPDKSPRMSLRAGGTTPTWWCGPAPPAGSKCMACKGQKFASRDGTCWHCVRCAHIEQSMNFPIKFDTNH